MPEVNDVRTESYLVRLWRDDRHSGWRAFLQHVRTGRTHHFARPEALWAFLQSEMTRADGRAAEPVDLEATTAPDSPDGDDQP
jgi:phage baseplate assembly protein gpV